MSYHLKYFLKLFMVHAFIILNIKVTVLNTAFLNLLRCNNLVINI